MFHVDRLTFGAQPRAGFARFAFCRRAFRLVGCSALIAGSWPTQPVVVGVRADPKPDEIVASVDADRAIMQTNSSRPECPTFLK